jgi:hypothetical protein
LVDYAAVGWAGDDLVRTGHDLTGHHAFADD